MKKYILILFSSALMLGLASCSSDDLNGSSIFPTTPPERDSLDMWILKNYTYPYNVQFKYKMEDIESDKKYNLVPADSAKAAKLAIIIKYLWFEAYDEEAGQEFTKTYCPRVIHIVGSHAYNSEGTEVLGTAEGGLKVTLYMVNDLTASMLQNYSALNYYYFHTMHHEFTHILNQKKPYNTAFDKVTESGYVSGDWYQISDAAAHKAGFVTPYAMNEPREDFAEMNATYITSTPEEWAAILASAGDTGAPLIKKKLELLRTYMRESWGIDLDDMRSIILRRANNLSEIDLEHLK